MLPTKPVASILDQLRNAAPSVKPVKPPTAKPPKAVDPIAPKTPKFNNPAVSSGAIKQSSLLLSAGLLGAGALAPWAGTILGRGIGADVLSKVTTRVIEPVADAPGAIGNVARYLRDKEVADPEDWIVQKMFPNSAGQPAMRSIAELVGDSGGGMVGGAAGAAGTVGLASYLPQEDEGKWW